MSAWRDQLHALRRVNDTLTKVEMRMAVHEAWLNDRVYSAWPMKKDSARLREMRWQTVALSQMFTRTYIVKALARRE